MEQYLNLNLLTQNGILENEFHFQLLIIILFLYFFLISTFTLLLIKHSIYSSKKKLSVSKPKFKNRRSEKPSSTNPEDDFWRKFYNLLKILGAGIVIVGIIYVIYEFGGDSGSNPSMDPGASSEKASNKSREEFFFYEKVIQRCLETRIGVSQSKAIWASLLENEKISKEVFDSWHKKADTSLEIVENAVQQAKIGKLSPEDFDKLYYAHEEDWNLFKESIKELEDIGLKLRYGPGGGHKYGGNVK